MSVPQTAAIFEDLDLYSGELDASVMFQQGVSDLVGARCLADVLGRFGYALGDRIDRRDLVLMYRKVEAEMEAEIHRLAHSGAYDEAKDMRARLTQLRAEFDGQQTEGLANVGRDQELLFERGSRALLQQHRAALAAHRRAVEEECEALHRDAAQTQAIERENLEKELARVHMPSIKYSKRLMDLFKAETSLIALAQYDDARKVRLMIDRQQPAEEAAFRREWERAALQAKREGLARSHRQLAERVQAKADTLRWAETRRTEKEKKLMDLRLEIHREDMRHSRLLESRVRPEMALKPSAAWVKREGYVATSASLRGQQLADLSKGKRPQNGKIFTDSLTDKHDFEAPVPNTMRLPSRSQELR